MRASNNSSVAWFFGLVLILSLPFYALGATRSALPFAPTLPISALMACVPMIAAMILVARQNGSKAARQLLASAFQVRIIPNVWWGPFSIRHNASRLCSDSLIRLAVRSHSIHLQPSPGRRHYPRLCTVFHRRGGRGNRLARLCLSGTCRPAFCLDRRLDYRRGLGAVACDPVCTDAAQCDMDHLAQSWDRVDAYPYRLAGRRRRPKHPDCGTLSYDEQFRLGHDRGFRAVL